MAEKIIDNQTVTGSGGVVEGTFTYDTPEHSHETAVLVVGDANSTDIDVSVRVGIEDDAAFGDSAGNTFQNEDLTGGIGGGTDNARMYYTNNAGAGKIKVIVQNNAVSNTDITVYVQTYNV